MATSGSNIPGLFDRHTTRRRRNRAQAVHTAMKGNAGKAELPKEALHPVIGPIPIPGWPLHGNMAARLYNSTSNLDKTTPNLPKIGNVGFNLGDGVRTPRPIDPLVPIAFTNARKGTEHKDGDSSEKTSG